MNGSRTRADRVEEYVESRVRTLQRGYLRNKSWAVAALAKLRRGIGKSPEDDVELFGLALANAEGGRESGEGDNDGEEAEDRPSSLFDDLRSLPDDRPTEEERAAFAAITLYAMHQQSHPEAGMHRRGFGLGRSARLLGRAVERDSVRRRFNALGTASTWDETLMHARGLIQQFRQHDIRLDYAKFARDLFDLQGTKADRVRSAWGRDYYRVNDPRDDAEAAPSSETSND